MEHNKIKIYGQKYFFFCDTFDVYFVHKGGQISKIKRPGHSSGGTGTRNQPKNGLKAS